MVISTAILEPTFIMPVSDTLILSLKSLTSRLILFWFSLFLRALVARGPKSEISFSKLIIYNRQDCCQGDLSWFTVYLFDGSGTPVGTYQLGNTEGMLKIEIAVSSFSLPTAIPSNLPSLSAFPSVSPTANPSN